MKKYVRICLVLMLVASCAPNEVDECFRTAGTEITKEFEVAAFSKIRFENDVVLYVEQGEEQTVRVTSGENVFDDIKVKVEGETLIIQNDNGCNLVRDYGITKAYVTTNQLVEIRNSSTYEVRSIGTLSFPSLLLQSDSSGGVEGAFKSGDFYLNLQCEDLRVSANGQSVFYLEGYTRSAQVSFADELPRLEAAELSMDTLSFFHRSANSMIVRPRLYMKGRIVGTGNVIALEHPQSFEVTEEFTGRLIFR